MSDPVYAPFCDFSHYTSIKPKISKAELSLITVCNIGHMIFKDILSSNIIFKI